MSFQWKQSRLGYTQYCPPTETGVNCAFADNDSILESLSFTSSAPVVCEGAVAAERTPPICEGELCGVSISNMQDGMVLSLMPHSCQAYMHSAVALQ